MILKTVPMLLLLMVFSCEVKNNNQVTTAVNKPNEEIISEVPEFADLLIQLESNILWEAVSDNWKTRRNEWIVECQILQSYNEKADLLIELESNILWSAVNQDWVNRRDAWTQQVLSAKSDKELGKRLAELESFITWESVSDAWRAKRDTWVNNCNNQ